MIDQITNNNQEIEMYYHMGSIHGEIRMMLNKYIYNQNLFEQVIKLYSQQYGEVDNVNINLENHMITFDIYNDGNTFQNDFSSVLGYMIKTYYNKLNECIDLFEYENPKYKDLKEKIVLLLEPNYYITLFRTAYIKHETCTSCIIHI